MISRIFNWGGPLIAIIIIGACVYYFIAKAPGNVPDITMPTKLIEAQRTGDVETVVTELEAIRNDPTRNEDEKAIATFAADGAEFQITGKLEDRIKSIRDIKAVVTNTEVTDRTRALALNVVAASFADTGRSPIVFDEIFKDAPFNQYKVEGDPEESIRKLYEWSYEIVPTYISAIRISRWYAEQFVFYPDLPANIANQNAARAIEFLNNADSLVVAQSRLDPSMLQSARYIENRHWRAINIGRLSRQVGQPYTNQYKKEYEDYLAFVSASPNAYAKGSLLYGRYMYAARLFKDNDNVSVKKQLDILAADLNALENPDTVAFVQFLRNTKSQPAGVNWTFIKDVSEISPTFRAAVDRLVLSAPTNSAPMWNDNY